MIADMVSTISSFWEYIFKEYCLVSIIIIITYRIEARNIYFLNHI